MTREEPHHSVLLSEEQVDQIFLENGGSFHGPNTETASIPQSGFYGFVEDVMRATFAIAADVAAKDVKRQLALGGEMADALRKLTNEAAGCWGMSEAGLRFEVGNTNYACVQTRIDEARALLTRIGGE